jgi:beta-glucosidase
VGDRAGNEIVQLYVHDIDTTLVRPPTELKSFHKVWLKPGETRTVTFTLEGSQLACYDPFYRCWVAEPGEFEILVGASSRDVRQRARFTLRTPYVSDEGRALIFTRFSARTQLGVILDDEEAAAVFERHLSEILDQPWVEVARGMSLEDIALMWPHLLTSDVLEQVDRELREIP